MHHKILSMMFSTDYQIFSQKSFEEKVRKLNWIKIKLSWVKAILFFNKNYDKCLLWIRQTTIKNCDVLIFLRFIWSSKGELLLMWLTFEYQYQF